MLPAATPGDLYQYAVTQQPLIAGGLELAADARGGVARARRSDDQAIHGAQSARAEIGFLHVRRPAHQHVAVLLLQVGERLERIHARLLRRQHGDIAARPCRLRRRCLGHRCRRRGFRHGHPWRGRGGHLLLGRRRGLGGRRRHHPDRRRLHGPHGRRLLDGSLLDRGRCPGAHRARRWLRRRTQVIDHQPGDCNRRRGRRSLLAGLDVDDLHPARRVAVFAGAILRFRCGLLSAVIAQTVDELLVGVREFPAAWHHRLDLVGAEVRRLDQLRAPALRRNEGLVGVGEPATEADGTHQRRHDHQRAAAAAGLLVVLDHVVEVGIGFAIAVLRLRRRIGRSVGRHVVAEIVAARIGLLGPFLVRRRVGDLLRGRELTERRLRRCLLRRRKIVALPGLLLVAVALGLCGRGILIRRVSPHGRLPPLPDRIIPRHAGIPSSLPRLRPSNHNSTASRPAHVRRESPSPRPRLLSWPGPVPSVKRLDSRRWLE